MQFQLCALLRKIHRFRNTNDQSHRKILARIKPHNFEYPDALVVLHRDLAVNLGTLKVIWSPALGKFHIVFVSDILTPCGAFSATGKSITFLIDQVSNQ
jgi:hypothetical protein